MALPYLGPCRRRCVVSATWRMSGRFAPFAANGCHPATLTSKSNTGRRSQVVDAVRRPPSPSLQACGGLGRRLNCKFRVEPTVGACEKDQRARVRETRCRQRIDAADQDHVIARRTVGGCCSSGPRALPAMSESRIGRRRHQGRPTCRSARGQNAWKAHPDARPAR
jgi:hypothetical protein